jgi:hypothetical protein
MIRQCVISVRKATDDLGNYSTEAHREICFRQPFNSLGLAIHFGFQKSYTSAFSECQLAIENTDNKLTQVFSFDRNTYLRRPLVEIRAAYSDERIKSFSDIDRLKNSLPLIYSGFPYYIADEKTVGGRMLSIMLNDISMVDVIGEKARITERFGRGMRLTDVLDKLFEFSGVAGRTDALKDDPTYKLVSLETDLYYVNRVVISDVIPNLCRQYGVLMTTDQQRNLVLRPGGKATTSGGSKVSAKTGMINYPALTNFTHWGVQTLFGMPKVFFPGDWMKIEDEFLVRNGQSASGVVEGAVVEGDYQWNDSTAQISYVVAPEGEPVTDVPVLNI